MTVKTQMVTLLRVKNIHWNHRNLKKLKKMNPKTKIPERNLSQEEGKEKNARKERKERTGKGNVKEEKEKGRRRRIEAN